MKKDDKRVYFAAVTVYIDLCLKNSISFLLKEWKTFGDKEGYFGSESDPDFNQKDEDPDFERCQKKYTLHFLTKQRIF